MLYFDSFNILGKIQVGFIKIIRITVSSVLLYSYVMNCSSVYAEDTYSSLRINAPNGVAGLDDNGKITSDINNQNIATQNIATQNIATQNIASQDVATQSINTQLVRVSTTNESPSDLDILIFYNREEKKGDNPLQAQTLYFASNSGDDHYHFVGDIFATQYRATLSTPSSSSAPCKSGEFKDDQNYHYVCVAPNKWKRVALSDF